MYLPNSTFSFSDGYSLQSILYGNKDTAPSAGGWSSTIGVVTAIVGNIVISFALNTQRYAHLRLGRDRDQGVQQEKRKQGRGKDPSSGSPSDQDSAPHQTHVADERAKLNAKSSLNGHAHNATELEEDETESSETQPLIPKINGRTSPRLSEDTARGNDDDGEQGDDKDDETPKEKSYLHSPIWWLGIALMVVGEAGNFLAYGFAPASIVSPLGVVALVSNCLIAPLLLGEKFRWRDGFGVLVAVGGCVVVVLSASASNPKLTPDAIWKLISHWEFLTYFGVTLLLIIGLAVASTRFGEKSILIDLGLVALFGGYTALSTKGVASLLSNTIFRIVTFPITYLLVAVLVFTAVMQIKYVNRALQRFNATMVIPTQFVLFTISVIVGSAVLYRDFEREEAGDAVKFVCGCALTFFGVWCITSGHGKDSDQHDDAVDEEDAIDLVDEENVMPGIRQRDDGVGRGSSTVKLGSSMDMPPPRRTYTTDAIPASLPQTTDIAASPSAGGLLGFNMATNDRDRLSHLSPGNASTIHPSVAPLCQTQNSAQTPPPLHATTSAPVVPTAPSYSTSFRPKTPLARTPSGPATDSPTKHIATTPRGNSVALLEPITPTQHRLLNRRSVVGLLPGPLTAPLSSSLSAIVADELRRSASSSIRRRSGKSQSRPRIFLPSTPDARGPGAPKRHSIASVDFEAEEAAAELRRAAVAHGGLQPTGGSAAVEGGKGGRMRSLSATLGEIFGSSTRAARRAEPGPAANTHDGNDRGRLRIAES